LQPTLALDSIALGRKRIFGVLTAQETCLVAANVVLPRWEAISPLPNPLGGCDVKGHFPAGERERRGKEGRGKKKKERGGMDGRTPSPPPRNKYLVTALQAGARSQLMTDDHVMFVACTRRRRRSMNSGSHHHNRPGCCHLVMTHTGLRRVQARTTQLAIVATPAAERVDEALPELSTHETVGDRVAARRDKRQQVDVVHSWR